MTDVAKDRTYDIDKQGRPVWPANVDQQTCFWCAARAGYVAAGSLCPECRSMVGIIGAAEGSPSFVTTHPDSDTPSHPRKRRWWRS